MISRIFLLILFISSFLNDVASSSGVPTGLMVNYKHTPSMGIPIQSPMIFTDRSLADALNRCSNLFSTVQGQQTSYQIVITLKNDGNDTIAWDSGIVKSSESVNVPYTGEQLRSSSIY